MRAFLRCKFSRSHFTISSRQHNPFSFIFHCQISSRKSTYAERQDHTETHSMTLLFTHRTQNRANTKRKRRKTKKNQLIFHQLRQVTSQGALDSISCTLKLACICFVSFYTVDRRKKYLKSKVSFFSIA